MLRRSHRAGWILLTALVACALGAIPRVAAGDDSRKTARLSDDKLWRRTIDLAEVGDFQHATETIRQLPHRSDLTARVRTWLEEYERKQAARRELDRADFEKYVGYAKARIEREEYRLALEWTLAAYDCAEDRDVLLGSPWVSDLVNKALSAADERRRERDWHAAWQFYALLGSLFEHEPRYQKLEREVLTHLRLDGMFKKDGNWKEAIERVRWKDAKLALEYIEQLYVEPVAFKTLAERGFEQLLLLAESKSAQELEEFEGLRNEHDLKDFEARVQQHLDQVEAAPSIDRAECVRRFRRVVQDINPETIRLPEELVVSELMRGALDPLDDFTTIIWPWHSREFEKHTRGDFVGVGISIVKNRADEIEVVSPLEDTPAYRAGIQAGDIITEVNGDKIKGLSINKVVEAITGHKDTEVTLTIRRGDDELEFPLVRAKVKIRSVKGVRRDPRDEERWDHWLDRDLGIGYIRVTNFQKNTVEDVDNILSDMSGVRGLVLDLRRNPGGLLDSAWQLASRFLGENETVVSTKARIKSENHTFPTPGAGPYSDLPLVVLVDERSASASEIVSGAVRDNKRGVVVGERTFGKFSVQNLISLGRVGAKLKITTASYYLPNGDSLHRDPAAETWGVKPDVPIRLVNKERINVYNLWREADLLGPPKPKAAKSDDDTTKSDDGTEKSEDDGVPSDAKDAEAEDAKADDAGTAVREADEVQGEGEPVEAVAEKLPPLKQPDENDRPKEDPQLDAALLLLRVLLVGESQPTLATAEVKGDREMAQP